MPNVVVLASGPITNHTDHLIVELVLPPDAPPAILIRWPGCAIPSVCPPGRFTAAATAAIAVLNNAMTELTHTNGQPR